MSGLLDAYVLFVVMIVPALCSEQAGPDERDGAVSEPVRAGLAAAPLDGSASP